MKTEDYYIGFLNMDHRTDRLAHMTDQLNRISLFAHRHRGKKPNEYDVNDPRLQTMYRRTPGAVACHFGQVGIMEEALKRNQHAIVFEDDCVFCSDFHKRIDYIEDWMSRNDFDIFWLGSSFHVNPPFWHQIGSSGMPPDCSAQLGYDAKRTDDPRIMRTFGAFATFAYIVNKDSIEKVLGLLNSIIHESIGIDWAMVKLQPQLKCFAFLPGCVKQMDNTSDIGTGMTNWSGFLKLNGTKENSAYVYQENMNDFNPNTFQWNEAQ